MDRLYCFRQSGEVRTLANKDDHAAREFDIINDVKNRHRMEMYVEIKLPDSLTDKQQGELAQEIEAAWMEMFYSCMRITDSRRMT